MERRHRIMAKPRPPRDPAGLRTTMIWVVLSLVCATTEGLLLPASGIASPHLVNAGASFAAGPERTAAIRTAPTLGPREAVRAPADSQMVRALRRTAHRVRLAATPYTVRRARRSRVEYSEMARPQDAAGRPSLAFRAHAPPA